MSTKTEKPKNETTIKLNNVRLSYPSLFVANAMKNPDGSVGKATFQATFLLNKKDHAAVIKQIEQMTERTALDKFGKKVTLKHVPLRDGDEKSDKEGYGDDVMFITAKSDSRPVVVDRDKSPLVKEDGKPYAGCYVNGGISLFAYSHPTGGKGVSASLRWVQFSKDGESFGASKVDVDTEIDEVTDDDVNNY
jgi:hypothetical protein